VSGDVSTWRKRPALDVTNPASAAEWLRAHMGKGELAGMFRQSDSIVFTPRVGEQGYLPLTTDERDDDGPAQVRPLTASQLASYLQLRYGVYKVVPRGKVIETIDGLFPPDAARPVVDHPAMVSGLRVLRGVTHTPLPRADGTILDTPGYDEVSGLLYLPDPGLVVEPVPADPTTRQATVALALLTDTIQEFSFVRAHDQANYLGLWITPLLRLLVPPPYKLGALNAPQPGSGKSLLAQLARETHGGVFRAEVPEQEGEFRKVITTILTCTTGAVCQLDNVSGIVRSSVLSGLLTSPVWGDRRLGGNVQVSARNDRLWIITGNNITLGGDLVRRTLWVTIDPAVPNPHLRTGFRIGDLAGWVRDHRGELLGAMLTLIRYWVAQGKPASARGSDSFALWTETVSGILAAAGHEGVFDHHDSARQTVGADDAEWSEFLTAIRGEFDDQAWTVKALLSKFQPTTVRGADRFDREVAPVLPLDVLPSELCEKATRARTGASAISKALGWWLRNREGRWAGGLTVRRVGDDGHDKVALWKIEKGG
jgi:hypothetical protein